MNPNSSFDIDYVANLARIALSDSEKKEYTQNLSSILTHFEKLNSVNTENIEPCAHAFPIYNVLREDIPQEELPIEALLQNAPKSRDNQIVVPRIVDDSN